MYVFALQPHAKRGRREGGREGASGSSYFSPKSLASVYDNSYSYLPTPLHPTPPSLPPSSSPNYYSPIIFPPSLIVFTVLQHVCMHACMYIYYVYVHAYIHDINVCMLAFTLSALWCAYVRTCVNGLVCRAIVLPLFSVVLSLACWNFSTRLSAYTNSDSRIDMSDNLYSMHACMTRQSCVFVYVV